MLFIVIEFKETVFCLLFYCQAIFIVAFCYCSQSLPGVLFFFFFRMFAYILCCMYYVSCITCIMRDVLCKLILHRYLPNRNSCTVHKFFSWCGNVGIQNSDEYNANHCATFEIDDQCLCHPSPVSVCCMLAFLHHELLEPSRPSVIHKCVKVQAYLTHWFTVALLLRQGIQPTKTCSTGSQKYNLQVVCVYV